MRIKLVIDISERWSLSLSLGVFFRYFNKLEENLMNVLNSLDAMVFLGATLLPVPGLAKAPSTQG